jgi:hypothetical protein
MARNTLTEEQRTTLLEWLAADHPASLIRQWLRERGWPTQSDRMLSYYRQQCAADIHALRQARRESALTTGLAVKEERVAQLQAHAETLAAMKWVPDKRGRLWNEKAWRETLDDIAKEVGGRVQRLEATGANGAPLMPPDLLGSPEQLTARLTAYLATAPAAERDALIAEYETFISTARALGARLAPPPEE